MPSTKSPQPQDGLLGPVNLTQPIPAAPEWSVTYGVTEQNGIPIIGEIRIRPTDAPRHDPPPSYPPGGITAALLRHVPINTSIIATGVSVAVGIRGEPLFSARALEHARRGQGIRHDDRFLAAVAALYVELLPTADDVYGELRAALSERDIHYGRDGARELVRKARARELLTGAPKGRAGGTLTPRAVSLLAD